MKLQNFNKAEVIQAVEISFVDGEFLVSVYERKQMCTERFLKKKDKKRKLTVKLHQNFSVWNHETFFFLSDVFKFNIISINNKFKITIKIYGVYNFNNNLMNTKLFTQNFSITFL